MRDGLQPRNPALSDPSLDYQPTGIYLWRHFSDAVGSAKQYMTGQVIIGVDLDESDVRDDWEFDMDDDGNSCAVVYHRSIPASAFVAVHGSTSPEFREQLAANRAEIAKHRREYRARWRTNPSGRSSEIGQGDDQTCITV